MNKVEGQRLVYQFTSLPKNMVYITDGDVAKSEAENEPEDHSGDDDDHEEVGEEDEGISDDHEDAVSSSASSSDQSLDDADSRPETGKISPSPAMATGQRARSVTTAAAAVTTTTTTAGPTPTTTTTTTRPEGAQRGTVLRPPPNSLIQQQHLPIVSAEMLRTLQNLQRVQSLQPAGHSSVFQTAQLLGNLCEQQAAAAEEGPPPESSPGGPEERKPFLGQTATHVMTLQLSPLTSSDQ